MRSKTVPGTGTMAIPSKSVCWVHDLQKSLWKGCLCSGLLGYCFRYAQGIRTILLFSRTWGYTNLPFCVSLSLVFQFFLKLLGHCGLHGHGPPRSPFRKECHPSCCECQLAALHVLLSSREPPHLRARGSQGSLCPGKAGTSKPGHFSLTHGSSG